MRGTRITRRPEGNAGFTLIELAIVVGIIAILAAIAVAQLTGFAARAKQTEAKELLVSISTAETAYFVEQSTYGTLSNIGFTPSATPKYYTNIGDLSFTYTGGTSYTGSCSANIDGDATMDIWQVTPVQRAPSNVSNDVQG